MSKLNLSENPYYDDFSESKNYHRILFRPGRAVQGRELTQMQTILQNQISRFGAHIFRDGSVVRGGSTTLELENVSYLKLEPTYTSQDVDLTKFINTFITDTSGAGIRAYVIATQEATDITPKTLILKYTSGARFDDLVTYDIVTEDGLYFASTSVTTPVVGPSSICSITEGTFFVSGLFAHVDEQTLLLDAYGNTPSYKIGLQIDEAIIDERQDSSLLDPAAGSSNYQAPGATRYRLNLSLAKRTLTSVDDSLFIELLRVENGILIKKIKYPIYSDLETTLARRTYDESGSYTVKPFHIALKSHDTFSNAYYTILESGKAYIMGYEFETSGPTSVKCERARAVANVYNYNLTIDYQNYIDVVNVSGPIHMSTLTPLTLHCVGKESINTVSSVLSQSTNIGTLSIRALDYQSGANATSIGTGVWRAYVTGANISNRTANSTGGTANTIIFDANASRVTDAYKGVKLRIVTHAGSNVGETFVISSYNGSTQTATLATGQSFVFGTPTAATLFSLDYELKDVESIVYGNTNIITTSMNVASVSKYSVEEDPYQGTFISDTNFNRMLFPLPYSMIADSSVVGGTPLTNSEYSGRKLYSTQSFVANVITLITASGITSAVNGSPLSATDAIDNIFVVIKNPGSGTLANNQVVNFMAGANTVTVTTAGNTSTYTITVPGAVNATADVYVKVSLPYSHALGSLVRSKTRRLANTSNVSSSGGIAVATNVLFYAQSAGANGAQINFLSSTIGTLQTPNRPQSLFVADGIRLAGVYDFGTKIISEANLSSAINITDRYTFDSGQRDNAYDYCSISLNPAKQGPTGNVVVYVDHFNHSGVGYFTADSYVSANISYSQIPVYTSPTTGINYQLRDVIDFRPHRKTADVTGEYDEVIYGVSGTNFQTDFSHYLNRIDKIILTKDKTFEVIQGVPSLTPTPPSDKDNAMTLYTLSLPAYTSNTSSITIKYVDNRRYTMRDIGTLEQRISNLEYYTSLNLLEKSAKDQEILDDAGLSRFKNGILVDPFTGHSIGDVRNVDYACAIDAQNHELRPPFSAVSLLLDASEAGSTHYTRNGSIFTLPYTANTFIDQPFASTALNINPFNTVAYIGQMQLDPSSDVWVDTNQSPDVLVNLEGDNDAWELITQNILNINPGRIFGTTWNSWQTTWSGISNQRTEISVPQYRGWLGATGTYSQVYENIISRDVADLTQQQVRVGVTTTFAPDVITRSIGNKVTDVSVVPYIRSRGVLFSVKMLAPNTDLFAFFDGTAVQAYVNRVNVIEVASNTAAYIDTYQAGEEVRVYEPARGIYTANAHVVRTHHNALTSNISVVNVTSGDGGAIANVQIVTANATFLIGLTSGANTRISGYDHRSGLVSGAGSSNLTFQHDMTLANTNSSNTNLIGQVISITSGLGLGQTRTISDYNVSTQVSTVSPSWTITPNTSSTYTIGQLRSDARGECHGVFIIPSTTDVRFRTGERVFRLIDNLNNTLSGSNTNGEVKYYAQGLLQTSEDTIISTRVPAIQRTILNDERFVTSTVVQREQVIGSQMTGYWDPLAQTFLVDQRVHPSGVQITGIRLLFKSKDTEVPLQIQVRPVVNGFPHSSLSIPGSQVVVDPDDIIEVSESILAEHYANTATTSALDDNTLYTQINFHSPLYLQPGIEYAIVLIANSVKYEVYASHMGQNLIGTTRLISSQPYLGSLFKSQNSTLWTPIQEEDLAFRLLYAQYDTSAAANVEFKISLQNIPSTSVPMDLFYLTAGNLVLPNTTVDSLVATTTAADVKEVLRSFQPDENTFFNDNIGRRIITNDPTSFKVRFLLSSRNVDISPVIDKDRLSVLAIENLVKNGGLANTDLVIMNSSTNYVGSNVTVAISGGNGSGANAYAVVVANTITSLVVDQPGTGYTGSPTITITGGGGTANAVVIGEDQSSGGPATTRYITRKVTLADGMDAGDFRVYFSAYRPKEANIDVYYKILSADDQDPFDAKNYQLMTIIQGASNQSLHDRDIKDFVYAPGVLNIADNKVQYGTFTSFKHFAIKVVMRSSDTTKVPRIRDFRVIAIPSLA